MYGSQLPIDIHCSKILDWLVTRRHCRKDWGENLANIRRKIKAALMDMPENEDIKKILAGSKLDYPKSKQIVEILRTTEADSKNFFGYYSSQRMKDWQEIVRCYERDCIYLAEDSTDLIRETNYEIPSAKRLINKLKQERDDLGKDRANQLRKSQQFTTEHQKLAQSYGINGVNVIQELQEKSKSLGSVMEEIAQLAVELKPIFEHYRDCAKLTSKKEASEFLTMLEYVLEHGNTTVYEWKYGEKPSSIELVEPTISVETPNPSEIELVDDEIDFGDDIPSSGSSSGFVHVDKISDNGNGSSDGNGCRMSESFVKLEKPESQSEFILDKVARGDDAKLVLEFRKSRIKFLNDLYELEAFLNQTVCNLTDSVNRTGTFASEGSTKVQQYDIAQINENLSKIKSILAIFLRDDNQILFQMNDSPLFIDNIKDKLSSKLKQASDCTIKAELLSERAEEIDRQIEEAETNLKKCIASTKELQIRVENYLRDLYGGRPINIMGCAN